MRRTITRLGLGAALVASSVGAIVAFSLPSANALGPEGCVAQGANGFIAVGTLTGTAAPAPPGPSANPCTFTALTDQAGAAGNDSVSWSVTVDTAHAAAVDVTGKACPWVADPAPATTSTIKGTGQAQVGYGCLAKGGAGSASAG